MGQCCKCGRETQNAYAYYSGDLVSATWPKTYTNMEERAAFLCTRCAMRGYPIWHSIGGVTISVDTAINAGSIVTAVIIGLVAALWFALFIYDLVVMLRDKPLPFYIYKFQAEKRLVKFMRKQNPGITYFAPSDYHNA
jgi:hypothetical protein